MGKIKLTYRFDKVELYTAIQASWLVLKETACSRLNQTDHVSGLQEHFTSITKHPEVIQDDTSKQTHPRHITPGVPPFKLHLMNYPGLTW